MSTAIVDHDVDARFCAYADPAIKLFGRDIPLTSSEASDGLSYLDVKPEIPQTEGYNEPMDVILNESGISTSIHGNEMMGSFSIKKPVDDIQIIMGAPPDIKGEESQGPLAFSQEKMPKKPDKLIPCPRCQSLDTKFCYFNNYNVNHSPFL